jgi:hypothetical protein
MSMMMINHFDDIYHQSEMTIIMDFVISIVYKNFLSFFVYTSAFSIFYTGYIKRHSCHNFVGRIKKSKGKESGDFFAQLFRSSTQQQG